MEGIVTEKWKNGLIFITTDDGDKYATYANWLDFGLKLGRRVAFDISDEPVAEGHCPFATNVQKLEFYGKPTGEATWMILPAKMRRRDIKITWCRCGCCGNTSVSAWHFCPHCGSKMIKTDEIRNMAKAIYKGIQSQEVENEQQDNPSD